MEVLISDEDHVSCVMSRSDISHMYPNIYLITSERAGDILNKKMELSPLVEMENLEISSCIFTDQKLETKFSS